MLVAMIDDWQAPEVAFQKNRTYRFQSKTLSHTREVSPHQSTDLNRTEPVLFKLTTKGEHTRKVRVLTRGARITLSTNQLFSHDSSPFHGQCGQLVAIHTAKKNPPSPHQTT